MTSKSVIPKYQVTCIGSCNDDWNTDIREDVLKKFAEIISYPSRRRKRQGKIRIDRNILLEVFEDVNQNEKAVVYLKKDSIYKFDKNKIKYARPIVAGECLSLGSSLRRPGGGATNCAYNVSSLFVSMGVESPVELAVLEASEFCRKTFKSELRTKNGNPALKLSVVRPKEKSFSNLNLTVELYKTGTLEKLDFTQNETEFSPSEKGTLEGILRRGENREHRMFVVDSIKDKAYSEAVFDYILRNREGNKFVLAATGSMLSSNYVQTLKMAEASDIYVSNVEEFYSLLGTVKEKKKVLRTTKVAGWNAIDNWERLFKETHRKGERKLVPNEIMIEGMLYLQKQQEKNTKRKGRVYVTCGELGAIVLDERGKIYWQETHPIAVATARYLNGAGDAFAGAVVAMEAVNGNSSSNRILTMSVAAGQICVRNRGANRQNMLTDKAIGKESKSYRGGLYEYNRDGWSFVR